METITIGIGEYKTARAPSILETHSLGSCVGVALYDSISKLAGMAHIMLPDSKRGLASSNPGKYADTAIKAMLNDLIRAGADSKNIVAKIAGGACMFAGAGVSEMMQIGAKNVLAVKNILSELKIPVIAEDCGANYGRTIEFHIDAGKLLVKSVSKGEKEI